MSTSLVRRLRDDPPNVHGEGDESWGLAWAALEWLERELRPGMATLETGSGSSTIVFAAARTLHQVVTFDAREEERIRAACAELGIPTDTVTFQTGASHDVLPGLERRVLDLALIDGAHGFPYPVLDWWHIAPQLAPGGRILLDDAYLPAVTAIFDYAKQSAAWEVDPPASFRTAVIRKLTDSAPPFDAGADAAHGRMSFRYLPVGRRIAASVRQRAFSTRAGLWLVRTLRPPAGRRP